MKLTALICVCILCTAVFIIRRCFKKDVYSLLLKVLSSMCFILLGFYSAAAGGSFAESGLILIGLICGMLGDIFLDLKYIDLPNTKTYTTAGIAAFILGHAFYITFIFRYTPGMTASRLIALLIAILGGVLIYATPKLMRLNYGDFRLLCSFYAAVLIFITAYALLSAVRIGSMFTILFCVGLVLFLISDLILSQIYFGDHMDTPFLSGLNHALYYAGQILIAVSIFWIG